MIYVTYFTPVVRVTIAPPCKKCDPATSTARSSPSQSPKTVVRDHPDKQLNDYRLKPVGFRCG
jgi:hypothetical protein